MSFIFSFTNRVIYANHVIAKSLIIWNFLVTGHSESPFKGERRSLKANENKPAEWGVLLLTNVRSKKGATKSCKHICFAVSMHFQPYKSHDIWVHPTRIRVERHTREPAESNGRVN